MQICDDKCLVFRGVAQFGQSAPLGAERSRVQISVPRLQNGVDLVTHFPHKEGYVGSNPTSATVTVADLVMRRIVIPDYAGPNPVSHLKGLIVQKRGLDEEYY